eukprot:9718388-Lingulodinium_polyedra.AAC.1
MKLRPPHARFICPGGQRLFAGTAEGRGRIQARSTVKRDVFAGTAEGSRQNQVRLSVERDDG